MKLNEWGDFFAGVFAPVAFLWLVIGYYQQGDELKQNTEALKQQDTALRLQVIELQRSVKQQEELVKVTREEVDLTKNNILRLNRKEKLKAQPKFRLRDSSSHSDCYKTYISNEGHSIYDVEITQYDGMGVSPNYVDHWDEGEDSILVLSLPEGYSGGHGDLTKFTVSYIDGFGERSTKILHFWVSESGYLKLREYDAKNA